MLVGALGKVTGQADQRMTVLTAEITPCRRVPTCGLSVLRRQAGVTRARCLKARIAVANFAAFAAKLNTSEGPAPVSAGGGSFYAWVHPSSCAPFEKGLGDVDGDKSTASDDDASQLASFDHGVGGRPAYSVALAELVNTESSPPCVRLGKFVSVHGRSCGGDGSHLSHGPRAVIIRKFPIADKPGIFPRINGDFLREAVPGIVAAVDFPTPPALSQIGFDP